MSEQHAQIKTENGMPPVQPEDEGFRVYIGNLPFDASEEKVREFVAPAGGEIINVSLPLKFGKKPSGFAFVGYSSAESAQKAVDQLNEKSFGDRTVSLQLARSKEETAERRKATDERRAAAKATRALEKKQKVIAEGGEIGADGEVKPKKKRSAGRRRTAAEGEDEVEGAEGAGEGEAAAKPKRKPRNRKPKAKEARIDGEETEGAAPAAEGEEKPQRAKKARKPRQLKLELTGEASKNTVFVGNLPFSVDDEALAEIFTNLSIKVKSAKVVMGSRKVRDETRPFRGSKGFGFVEVEDPAQQQEAVDKVAGTLIGDRTISAKIANEMRPIEKEAVEAVADVAQATV